jgi:hypothetical protein
MKTCNKCKIEKETSEFSKKNKNPDGLQRQCKGCVKEAFDAWKVKTGHKSTAAARRWRLKNPERNKVHDLSKRLRIKYGLTIDQYNQMIRAQNGQCAICCVKSALCVDHCHKNGNVRELLCNSCNTLLGHAKESEDILRSAIEYLKKFKQLRVV